jgi:hypothetical protein
MESQFPVAMREELWRLQEDIKDLFTTQGQHSERIMRLEKRRDEDMRVKNVWGTVSPFPGSVANSAQQGMYWVPTCVILLVLTGMQNPASILPPKRSEISTQIRSLA